MAQINIAGTLHNTEEIQGDALNSHVVAHADEILDSTQEKKQSEINADVQSELNAHDEALNAPSTGLEARVETLEEQVAFSGDFQTANTLADVVSGSGKITTANAVASIAEQLKAEVGYYPCTTAAGTAAKVIPASDAPNYVLTVGGSVKVKMTNKNTAANPTLKIGNAEAKPLYYGASRASSSNTWEAGEVIEVYYDGENLMANNVEGGGGDGVFDISVYNASGEPLAPAVYDNLTAALGNVPASKRKGGMSVKFILQLYTVAKTTSATRPESGTPLATDPAIAAGTKYKASDLSAFAPLPPTGSAVYYVSDGAATYTIYTLSKNAIAACEYVQYRYMKTDTTNAIFVNTNNWQGVDETPAVGSQNLVTSGGVAKLLKNRDTSFPNVGRVKTDGTTDTNDAFNFTDYITVSEGERFLYKGYFPSNASLAAVVGYDSNKSNPQVILSGTGNTQETEFVIPSGVAYIIASAANSSHASYAGRNLWHLDFLTSGIFKTGEKLSDVALTPSVTFDNNIATNLGILSSLKGVDILFKFYGAVKRTGEIVTNAAIKYAGPLPVNPGDIVYYKGRTPSGAVSCIIGYDASKENPSVVLAGTGALVEQYVIIPNGVYYIAANANIDSPMVLRVYNANAIEDDLLNKLLVGYLGDNVPFIANKLINTDGTFTDSEDWSITGFIAVNEGDIVNIAGYLPMSTSYISVAGYSSDNEASFVQNLLTYTVRDGQFSITVPSGINFVVVCIANSNHTSYSCIYCRVNHRYNYTEIKNNYTEIKNKLSNINDQLIETYKEYNTLRSAGGNLYWSHQVTEDGNYVLETITAPTSIKLYVGSSGSSTLVRELGSSDITNLGNNKYMFEIKSSDILAGAKYCRIDGITPIDVRTSFYKYEEVNVIEKLEIGDFKGKNIAVLGDSISTDNDLNPYITILTSDVGNEIQSYVTYWDIYKYEDSTLVPSNKSIGGVALTEAMIGTLQSFTPVADDIGKKVGVAPTYYNWQNGWADLLCEKLEANLINASWSGGGMCSGQAGEEYALSHAWSDYSIARCAKRDEDGNKVNPDVIIIYRGTNDFSHKQGVGTNMYAQLDSDYDLGANGYPDTDVYDTSKYGFYRAYYLTVKKLRAAYPNALIYCCTLNVFKRVTYDRFPTRNGQYTLPQMNNAIRNIADTLGCGIIEIDKDGITFENCYSGGYLAGASSSTHPTAKGQIVIANKVYSDMKYLLRSDKMV